MTNSPTVLLHVSDRPEDIVRALGSARTLHAHRPEFSIRIIVNGPAITSLTVGAPVLELSEAATVEACEVGMRGHDIRAEQLQPGVRTTASAVVALSDGQFDGAAYVRI